MVRLPEGCDAEALEDADGVIYPVQHTNDGAVVSLKKLPSKGSRVYKKAKIEKDISKLWYSIENTAGNKTFEWKHCQISYDPSKQTYRMISDSPEKILLLKEDNVIGTLEQGERVRVGRPVTLQIQGKEERLHLK